MGLTTTKNKLAEQVIRRLNGGDSSVESQYDKREIILFIEQALAALVKSEFMASLRIAGPHIGSQYISSFINVPILRDEDRDEVYSIIPHDYVNLPNDRGIQQVSMMKDQTSAFVPVRNGSTALFSKSPASRLEGRIGFYPEGNRIYYKKDLLKDGCDKVLIKLIVPSPSELDDDDPYPIPTDMQLPVINEVLKLMGVQVQTDDVNDNSNK